ncbi:OLC1v1001478C1 [Oldenlandia corymbosa var. corymbosa]|uniref:OLC1v1001478C1 n=1 Tax=Oldenlandia corymbosa var. corymbosa TaxID=529605 RepID=A0AAV1D7M3_OLDCO|nr:OLC1v1001478C1 [Oldenlandia corymbosa var. corymbosa]
MEDKSWVVEVDDEANRLDQVIESEKKNWEKHSIYKLPACVATEGSENCYQPQAISFGPYHYDDPKLQPMEAHKKRALLRFLKRSKKTMRHCVDSLSSITEDLMAAYDSLDQKWEEDQEGFMMMMMRDGCFMLELLRVASPSLSQREVYDEKDPIFSNHGHLYMMPYFKRDMLMLENQLPMLLLTNLLSLDEDGERQSQEKKNEAINGLIRSFFFPEDNDLDLGECAHVLDAYRKLLLLIGKKSPDPIEVESITKRDSVTYYWGGSDDIIPSASELVDSGVTIRKSKTRSIKDIRFVPGLFRGVLYIPPVMVDDTTQSIYLNLMAYERFHIGIGNDVTAYVAFMDDLIDNAKDVNLLKSNKIIQNAYGSDKNVAELFNTLSINMAHDTFNRLVFIRSEAKEYCDRHWNKWRGILIRSYFNHPWAVISLIAAIFLFTLTILGTSYTIAQFYHEPSTPEK